ncbi:hypothetical protein SRABI106_03316 [Rahnella aquatilis]|nr:hypothetical protein SRABI106_03316 [Rahnella aquatilis]
MRCAFQQRNTGTVFQYFQRSTDRGLAEAEQRGDRLHMPGFTQRDKNLQTPDVKQIQRFGIPAPLPAFAL